MASSNLLDLLLSLLLVLPLSHSGRFVKGDQTIQRVAQTEFSGENDHHYGGKLIAGPSGNRAHVVVAQDGSGNFRTIQDAVNKAPDYCYHRYVIHIKAGGYQENVLVDRRKWNITLTGDGKGRTVVISYRGGGILDTAALVALGDGFSAQYMTFENRAGPHQGQAVAMRSDSHRSTFYRCSFLGYQDTLFPNINFQFYKECDVVGTIDFIFGDAAVVFQDCNIYARRPLPGQANVIMAQGKTDPNTRAGIVLENCYIAAYEDLGTTQTFLGRPWQRYSTAVVMESYLDRLIDPRGWKETMESVEFGATITFREYGNSGPGSSTRNRMRWRGYKSVHKPEAVKGYTVGYFIDGDQWLPSHGVPYKSGL